jgi:LPXTG-motif cell wall-anchored protein
VASGYALESAENNAGINAGIIKLVNRRTEGYVIPETGGIGTHMYTTVGVLLIVISTACLVYNRRKRRRVGCDSF